MKRKISSRPIYGPRKKARTGRKRMSRPRYKPTGDPELKFRDTIVATVFNNPGSLFGTGANINVVPQGDTQSERGGRKIVIKAIRFKGYITKPENITSTLLQFALVLDTQTNGVQADYDDVWTGNTDINHHVNLENSMRFKIIKVWRMKINTNAIYTGDADVEKNIIFNWNKRCDIPIIYDNSATTGAIATQRSNSLALYQISVIPYVETGPTLRGIVRIRYYDS